MISTSTKGLALLVIFLTMLSAVEGANWQGSGNITRDHLNFFWNYINANFSAPTTNGKISPFCEQFSTALNLKWDPAWNVAVSVASDLSDTVLYGYAYNDHWYWYNGYKSSGNMYYAIVIWKDYNCQGWKTIDEYANSAFSSDQKAQIGNAIQLQSRKWGTNIWNIADDFMTSLAAQSLFSGTDHAYTLVITPSYYKMWARVCCVGYNFYVVSKEYSLQSIGTNQGNPWGNMLLFQTR